MERLNKYGFTTLRGVGFVGGDRLHGHVVGYTKDVPRLHWAFRQMPHGIYQSLPSQLPTILCRQVVLELLSNEA